MGWWNRHADVDWQPPARPEGPLYLTAPRWAGLTLDVWRVAEVGGRTVEWRRHMPARPTAESRASQGVVDHDLLMCRLSEPLQPFLVTNDFFLPVSEWTVASRVEVPLPPDDDPYDGKVWRVHASAGRYARALLDDTLWRQLVDLGERSVVTFAIDGDRVLAERRPGRARQLVAFAEHVERRLAEGVLDAWRGEVQGAPPAVDAAERRFPHTGWLLVPADRAVLFALARLWPAQDAFTWVAGQADGQEFLAVETQPGSDKVWPLSAGLVLLRLPHPVPGHVSWSRRALLARGDIDTEWVDFNAEYAVRAHDRRVGHELTTPRLMAFLHDHGVGRVDAAGPWLIGHVTPFATAPIRDAVATLADVRRLLPGYDVGRSGHPEP